MTSSASAVGTAIVTGACGGIGAAIVQYFADRGWRVLALDRHIPDAGSGLPDPGPTIEWHVVDLADPDEIEGFWQGLAADPSDSQRVIVNNAARQLCASVDQTSAREWDKVLNTNLRAPFLMAANGLPWLRGAASAAVVNVTSVHANATSPKMSAYAASKGGLEALTRSLAIEWGSERIRVNAVAPAAIDTSMLRDGLNRGHLPSGTENALRELGARHPLGRIGLPEEVASAVYFLADARTSAFTTGTVLSVDGGAMSKLSTE